MPPPDPIPDASLPPRPTLARTVEDFVRALVFDGEVLPGQRLVTDQIAERLGMSREPVREALRQMDGGGLVQLRERRGAVIVEFDCSSTVDLLDLLRVRLHLEPWIAAEAADRHTVDDLAAIDAALAAGSAGLAAGNGAQVARAHHDLLQAVAQATHNRSLLDAVTPLHNRTALAFSLVATDTLPDGWPTHRAVRDAIASGDAATARRLTRQHLDAVSRAVRRAEAVWRPRPVA